MPLELLQLLPIFKTSAVGHIRADLVCSQFKKIVIRPGYGFFPAELRINFIPCSQTKITLTK
jgi:hypothetical protein